ncbi:MAG: hypothetical protein CMJ64_00160 [Planctomycetaceae bacterium]|nr:hypothetical protein [Planctomycetaceae bacterium]
MPVIVISRGTLAGAALLAESVASELQIPCASREIIAEAAHTAGVSEDVLVEQMDRHPSFFNRYSRERDLYLLHIRSALCQQAAHGSFVYHGHGGNFLLTDISNLIRVRVVASVEFRVAAVMESQGLGPKEAEKYVHRIDKYREKWARYLYGIDWQDPSFYDLIFNLEKLDVEDACKLLTQCTRLERFAWTEESKQNIADVALAAHVTAALAKGGELYKGRLELAASANVLTISGCVRSKQSWHDVRAAAETVIGDAELCFDVTIASDGFEHVYPLPPPKE